MGRRSEACRGALSRQGFANPDVYEFLEAEGIKYAIRLPANRVLQERIRPSAQTPGWPPFQ
jgi:hypothetical protein